jgi:hypothetical protein
LPLRLPSWQFTTAVALVAYLVFAGALAYTKRPWADEAWFANMALNIAENGKTGISVLHPKGNANMLGREYRNIDQEYYAWVPVQQAFYALFYKIAGFGVLRMRALSLLWGIVVLVSWFCTVHLLTGERELAALTAALLAADFPLLYAASDGRMDIMCAALSYGALAVYLRLREQRLTQAILLSQALAVTAGLTHPIGAIGFITLFALTVFLDRRRLAWRHLIAAGGVYLFAAAAAAAYMLQNVDLFREHLGTALTGRLGVVQSTGNTFIRELTVKYKDFYAPAYAPTPLNLVRLTIPLGYLASLAACLVLRPLRQARGLLVLAGMAVVSQLSMAVLDSGKLYYYLVHSTPYYAAVLATATGVAWKTGHPLRYASTALAALLVLLQWGWVAVTARKDGYHNSFLPMVEYVRRQIPSSPAQPYRITASAELGFALGFGEPLRDDALIGYQSGRHPDLIVFEERSYESHLEGFSINRPEVAHYIRRLLATDFVQTFTDGYYKVYTRKQPPSRSAPQP